MDTSILQGLLRTIELKDRSTAAHTWRVTLYARAMAEHAGRPHDVIDRITQAAALHDIGKIDIPDHVLVKPGSLNDDEYRLMQTHTTLGHERLESMGIDDPIMLELVRHHHERWDGLGYPDKIKGEDIALGPRYFAVIDSFDAMTSIRPYRETIGEGAAESAIDELIKGSGTRYWPEAVDMFVELFRKGELNWILHYFNDDNPVPVFEGLASVNAANRSSEI